MTNDEFIEELGKVILNDLISNIDVDVVRRLWWLFKGSRNALHGINNSIFGNNINKPAWSDRSEENKLSLIALYLRDGGIDVT